MMGFDKILRLQIKNSEIVMSFHLFTLFLPAIL